MVRHWHRPLREAVDAPSLEAFRSRVEGPLGRLIYWAEGVESDVTAVEMGMVHLDSFCAGTSFLLK